MSSTRPHAASLPGAGLPGESLQTVLASLDDAKAEDVITIDIAGKSVLGDHMVIASGRSHRHVGAIADRLVGDLKQAGFGPVRVEGLPHCDWVLVDLGDVIVHVFRPEVRGFYNLEKMWMAEPLKESDAERRARA
jgi:ribosome-associated protein